MWRGGMIPSYEPTHFDRYFFVAEAGDPMRQMIR